MRQGQNTFRGFTRLRDKQIISLLKQKGRDHYDILCSVDARTCPNKGTKISGMCADPKTRLVYYNGPCRKVVIRKRVLVDITVGEINNANKA